MSICDAIGIDFGTSFCRAAVFRNGKVEIIKNKNNNESTPSVVISQKDEDLVGEDALEGGFIDEKSGIIPRNVIFNIKRLIGKKLSDEKVLRDQKYSPLHLTEVGCLSNIQINCRERNYSSEYIAGRLLFEMKIDAERYLNNSVTKAMITVPDSFDYSQRKATMDAAELAGFEEVRLINKPTATAINYYHDHRIKATKIYCVLQIGGGSFDASIIRIDSSRYEVISSVGNSHLGGVDFDRRMIDCFVETWKDKKDENFRKNMRQNLQVRQACEQAKIELSNSWRESVKIDAAGYSRKVTREDYEKRCRDLFVAIEYYVEKLFKKSGIRKRDIDDVLMVGGTTRNPKVQELLMRLFDYNGSFHYIANQLGVRGAAIQAARTLNRKIVDIQPKDIEVKEFVVQNKHRSPCKTEPSTSGNVKTKDEREHGEPSPPGTSPPATSKVAEPLQKPKIAVGIDIGTTSSRVAVFHNGRINVLDNENGKRTTPSTVKFTEQETLVGEKGGLNVTDSVMNVKRFMGMKFSDSEVQWDMGWCSYNVVDYNSRPAIEVKSRSRLVTPEEISSYIIRKMKMIAANFVENEVKEAVITVPSCFNNDQRQATIDAATIAGLDKIHLINSSTAAAVAYYIENPTIEERRNMFILSFGGGSIEVSVFTVDGLDIKIRSSSGYRNLGGMNFDDYLIWFLVEKFKETHFSDGILNNKRALYKLREASVEVKRKLSSLKEAEVDITSLFDDEDFGTIITRKEFEKLCNCWFDGVRAVVETAFSKTSITKSQIDDVLLIGGTTRIPKVQAIIKEFFEGEDKIRHSVNFDEACVYGAAVVAAHLSGVDDENIMNLKVYDSYSTRPVGKCDGGLSNEEIRTIIAEIKKTDLKTEEFRKLAEAKNELEEYTLAMKKKLKPLDNRFGEIDTIKNCQLMCEETLEWMNMNENIGIEDVFRRLEELKKCCEIVIIKFDV